jgi:hypothetical protein
LQAPFDGTASGIEVRQRMGQPGQPVMTLADLNGLHIETTDLNEIDVARWKPATQSLSPSTRCRMCR